MSECWLAKSLLLVTILIYLGQQAESIEWTETELQEKDTNVNIELYKYDITLDLVEASDTMSGRVEIHLYLSETRFSDKMLRLVLHAHSLLIIDEIYVEGDSSYGRQHSINQWLRDRRKNLIAIEFENSLRIDPMKTIKISLNIKFRKPNLATIERGIYLPRARLEDGQYKLFAILDISSTEVARTIFPCFDTVRFRSRVKLTMNLQPKNGVSNQAFFSEFGSEIPLSSVALALGDFNTISFSDGLNIRVFNDGRSNNSSALDTASVVSDLKDFYSNYLQFSSSPSQFDIYVMPETACRCQDEQCAQSPEFILFSQNKVIGTPDSLLISTKSTDSHQGVRRVLTLARAVVMQYHAKHIHAAVDWTFECAAAYLAIKAVQAKFPYLDSYEYVLGELFSNALDYNARPGDQGSMTLATQPLSNCRSKQFADARFAKAAALWYNLSMAIGLIYDSSREKLIISDCLKYADPNPTVMFLNLVARSKPYKTILRRFLRLRLDEATYDEIRVMYNDHRIVLTIQTIETSEASLSERPSCHTDAVSERALQKEVFWTLTVTFFNLSNGANGEKKDLTCTLNACFVLAPAWFEPDNDDHFVLVSTKPSAPRYVRITYSDQLLNKLTVNAEHIDMFELTQIIDDMHGMAKLSDHGLVQLQKFVLDASVTEKAPLVLDAYLRLRESLVRHKLSGPEQVLKSLNENLNALLQRVYDELCGGHEGNNLGVVGRLCMRVMNQLVELGDKRVIYSELKITTSLHIRQAIYSSAVMSGPDQVQLLLVHMCKQMKLDEYDDKMRLLHALAKSKIPKVVDYVTSVLNIASPTTRG